MTNEEKAQACLARTLDEETNGRSAEIMGMEPMITIVARAMVQFALEHANEEVERRRAAEAEVLRLTRVINGLRSFIAPPPTCTICGAVYPMPHDEKKHAQYPAEGGR